MKSSLTLILLFLVILTKAQPWYYQNFDGANNTPSNSIMVTIGTNTDNIWQIGRPQKTMFSAASTTPNVIITDTLNYYPIKNVSTFSFYATPPYLGCQFALQWKQKLDMDKHKDGGLIYFSTNSGNTWQNAHNNPGVWQFYGYLPGNKDTINSNEYCFSGKDTVWRDVWLCLSPNVTLQNDTIYYKFVFKSDSINNNREGWMIDNMFAHQTYFHPVKEHSKKTGVSVYPTITNGIVNIEMDKTTEKDRIDELILYNQEGKLMEDFGPNNAKLIIDLGKHSPGLYYLKVKTHLGTENYPVMYEKN